MEHEQPVQIDEQRLLDHESNGQGFAGDEEIDPENLLDVLRQERIEAAEDEKLISVPGYDRIPLFVKYRMIDGSEIRKIGAKNRKNPNEWDRNLMTAIDVMITAAVGIYVEVEGDIRPLTWQGAEITGYTEELAQALQMKNADTARKVVLELFHNIETYVASHSAQLQAWFAGTSNQLDRIFLGES